MSIAVSRLRVFKVMESFQKTYMNVLKIEVSVLKCILEREIWALESTESVDNSIYKNISKSDLFYLYRRILL